MKRRDFLKTSAILFPIGGSTVSNYGWLPPILPSPEPTLFETYPSLEGSGAGRVVLLYKYIEKILKKSYPAYRQQGPDCTSMAGGQGIDFVQAIQATLQKKSWINRAATEYLHIGGRQVIGKRKKGGVGIKEAMTFAATFGIIFRQKYKFENQKFNFTNYDYQNAIALGKDVPDWLLNKGQQHRVGKLVKVSTWREVRDAVRNLYPIVIGSKVGFDGKTNWSGALRDKDGFCEPKGTWYHAWLLIGVDDRHKRPGGCLMNSHGENWVKGPTRNKQPNGSIWVGKDVIQEMVSKYNDSYAICDLKGFQPKKYQLW